MKCSNCKSEDLEIVEESYDNRKNVANIITAVISMIFIILYVLKLDAILNILCPIFIGITICGNYTYRFIALKTSRTKVICKKCGMWWYIENDKPNTIYVDKYSTDRDNEIDEK